MAYFPIIFYKWLLVIIFSRILFRMPVFIFDSCLSDALFVTVLFQNNDNFVRGMLKVKCHGSRGKKRNMPHIIQRNYFSKLEVSTQKIYVQFILKFGGKPKAARELQRMEILSNINYTPRKSRNEYLYHAILS